MKKIFTLFVALMATANIMAQMPSTMQFVGKSEYSATIMGVTAGGGSDSDTLTVANIDVANACSDISVPSLTVEIPDMFSKTVPAITLTSVPFTMNMDGGVNISWAADSLQYTVKEGTEDKTVIVKNLSGSFSTATNKMSLSFNMKYGSMPGEFTFSEKDADYLAPDGISFVPEETQGKVCKVLLNGKIVVITADKQYNASGVLLK